MRKFKSVLFKLVLLGLLLSPVMLVYWFLTDPINCITNLIGAWLWTIMVIIPLTLIIVFLWGVFSLVWSIIKTIFS
jgi:hypothetical protein